MAHRRDDTQRIAEPDSAFTALSDTGKDRALILLRALSFAQAVMNADARGAAGRAGLRQAAGSR